MTNKATIVLLFLANFLPSTTARGDEKPIPQAWDYATTMKKTADKFHGRPGVVLHIGDSITYSNPYGQWPRAGAGKTPEDKAILKWMHMGADNDTDGWWLARFDHPDGGRSYTACGGIRANEMLAGGKQHMPPLATLLDTYKPQMVVFMLGTNDASARRTVNAYQSDMAKAVDLMLERGIIPIVSTIPPHHGQPARAKAYNEALRELAKKRSIPLIDYEKEILKRRPEDWNGTLLGKNDVHPTVGVMGTMAASAPTAENLRNSGYLLRGWLSVQKIAEVKRTVLDGRPAPAPEKRKKTTPTSTPPEVRKPTGEAVRVPVTRDTWFSNVGPEANCNLGGASQLKLKSHQEMSLIDIDPKALRGRVIQGATLHLHHVGRGTPPLHRVTVGSFGSEWVEGTSPRYAPQKGSSTHNHRRHPDVPWTVPGSDLCSVMLGEGGTLWRMADAFPPDERGWQRVAVDPAVVAARVAGISYGFLLFDDTGSEWTRDGEKFNFRLFPNRFVHSRESRAKTAPYLTIFLGAEDKQPPPAPTELRAEIKDLPAGEAWVSWLTPADEGTAGTAGFFVTVDGKEVPRYLIPLAGKRGERALMHLRDLDLKPGAEVEIGIRAVDGAGNVGPTAKTTVRVSSKTAAPLPGEAPKPFAEQAPLPRLGEAEVAILDELDKIHPVTGNMIPQQPEGYLAANHLWSAKDKQIRLHAARNEFIAFQVLLRGTVKNLRPKLTFQGEDGAKIKVEWGNYHHINSKKGPLPDPIVPLAGAVSVPAEGEKIEGQKSGSLHAEIYVPHDIKAGEYKGRFTLEAGEQTLALKVSLRVWDFTLPDYLSFLPEMNCYGLPGNERAYYRLAHRHRTFLNRVPYSHNGSVHDGCAPGWDGRKLDWSAWDRRFGPYFDGSAFADLPRRSVPIEGFYLPMFENWPTPMAGNYNGSYWADQAFPASYRRNFVEVSRQMAEHLQAKNWHDSLFHVFFNGKVDFKRRGWSRGTSPWLLDEPASFQDFWALRYFGEAFHEGRNQAPGQAKLVFRCDISRPQWQRDTFDGLLDYNVVGGAMRPYHRLVFDRKKANGELVVEYGGSNAIEEANMQAVGWSLDSWALGSDGVLPWQTVGNRDSWRRADSLALFYPGRDAREREPIPSVRLKAFRRGQQDVEYLTLLGQVKGEPRWALGQRVREALRLAGVREGTGFAGEDAGVIHFAQLKPQEVWALRVRVGQVLSDAAPPPKRRLIELRTPTRHPKQLSPRYVSIGEVPPLKEAASGTEKKTDSGAASGLAAPTGSLEQRVSTQVRPFLQRYCISCHGPKKPKASLDLSRDSTLTAIAKNVRQWGTVLERLQAQEMPPEEATRQPDSHERAALIGWIREMRDREANRNAGDPGTVLARRLSNAEFDYTIRDLTGVDIRPTREFPVDPANEAGFDNSGESLAMSPALLKKYLAAARRVADHVVFKPDGFVFAPHPVVTDTDRDQYCVQRIIDFYEHHKVDVADYFFAAWKYRHRAGLGRPDAELSRFAAEAGLSAKYLSMICSVLTEGEAIAGPLAAVRKLWCELPGPDQTTAARPACERLRDVVLRLRRQLKPKLVKLHTQGISAGSQPFVLGMNRQLASRHRTYSGEVLSDLRTLAGQLKNSDAELVKLFAVKDTGAENERRLREAIERFCAVFPDAFFVSDRGPYFDPKGAGKGRPLTAGFHLMHGYFRDDQPLCELILDEPQRRELDSLWHELNFVTQSPRRQYKDFIFFERAEPPRFLREAEFDFARSEDKDAISEAKMNRLAKAYRAKARQAGANGAALEAINTYFTNISADIRRVERGRLAAEPSHLAALVKFAERAYRRPLSSAERDEILAFYRTLRRKDELGHEAAVRDTLVTVLLSPHFCYRVDLAAAGTAIRPLSDYALASRLSYFLWSSMPDAELLAHAAAADLHQPKVLKAQTRRMLRDPRVRGLATEFGGNWLDFRRFEEHNSVDRQRFPSFTNELRQAMFEEPIHYFLDMAQRNRSVLDLLYGIDTFVNRPLARHYGMLEPKGSEWVHVEDARRYGRGGMLPMAVFLTKNAPGLRTSPVKRGYWVVRRLLGETIPPPPPTVPELPKDEAKLGDMTLPQLLARHRADKNCAACHRRFDSVGLVFEGFGPIGERRAKDLGGHPVQTAATFPDGSDHTGLPGLRAYLREKRQDDYVDNLCRKLFSYALGRGLLLSDRQALNAMRSRLASEGHSFGGLVEGIVTSPQFLTKRGRDDPRGQ